MQILIFGAGGFIGSHLTRYIVSQGHEVVALCRSGIINEPAAVKCVKWAFGMPLNLSILNNVSCAIHLAHDFNGEEGAQSTLKETLLNVSNLRAAGVHRQLFFSSYSAGEHATSLYGRTKWAIENALAGYEDIVIVRPGLVLGNGGLHGRIRKWAQRLPVIPLPNGGVGQVPVIDIDRLCEEALAVAESVETIHVCNLFERDPRSLRKIVLDAAAEGRHKPWIVPVPASLIIFGLQVASVFRLPLPVNVDNLEGFMANQLASHTSTLQD